MNKHLVNQIPDINFREAMSYLPSGIVVVTVVNEHKELFGLTIGSFNSLSLDPPLIYYNLDKKSEHFNVFSTTQYFTVNFLCSDQENISNLFASRNKDFESFKSWDSIEGKFSPLNQSSAYLCCKAWTEYEGGDHLIIVGQVVQSVIAHPNTKPLIYCRRHYWTLGSKDNKSMD